MEIIVCKSGGPNTNTELLDRILLSKPQEKGEIREKLGRNQAEATRADKGLYQEVLASVDCPVTLYTGGLSRLRCWLVLSDP